MNCEESIYLLSEYEEDLKFNSSWSAISSMEMEIRLSTKKPLLVSSYER